MKEANQKIVPVGYNLICKMHKLAEVKDSGIILPSKFSKKVNGTTEEVDTFRNMVHLLEIMEVGESLIEDKYIKPGRFFIFGGVPKHIVRDYVLSEQYGFDVALISSGDIRYILDYKPKITLDYKATT
jgi:hypothetical protein